MGIIQTNTMCNFLSKLCEIFKSMKVLVVHYFSYSACRSPRVLPHKILIPNLAQINRKVDSSMQPGADNQHLQSSLGQTVQPSGCDDKKPPHATSRSHHTNFTSSGGGWTITWLLFRAPHSSLDGRIFMRLSSSQKLHGGGTFSP